MQTSEEVCFLYSRSRRGVQEGNGTTQIACLFNWKTNDFRQLLN